MRTGWAPKGERLRAHAPFGAWQTQTFIAGLRRHGMVAPWLIDAPMKKARFETYVETQLAPGLAPGDVVILDNVAFHKSERAAELMRQRGAWLLHLPAYSPDRKGLRKAEDAAAKTRPRSFSAICRALKDICDLFPPEQCRNVFKATGYEAD